MVETWTTRFTRPRGYLTAAHQNPVAKLTLPRNGNQFTRMTPVFIVGDQVADGRVVF
jgi:hypothetical protein